MSERSASRWRVARVDKGAIRAVPDRDLYAESQTWALSSHGTLPAVIGEPMVPAVGDWLHVQDSEVRIAPRISELLRDSAGATSREQVIAANVEIVLIAEPLEPLPALGRIERLITLAHRSGAKPVIVLTKADLVEDAEFWVSSVRAVAPNATVCAISATSGAGLQALNAVISEAQTMVLVGPSGAGKSTLVNALAGEQVMQAGDVRGDSRGKHTTTHRQLVPLPGGAVLIDTPGLRSIGLVATAESVAATFTDIEELSALCKFNDCAHTVEPGCAVQAAIESGELPERRLKSWRSLTKEAQRQEVRADARLSAERNREYRRATKANRASSALRRR